MTPREHEEPVSFDTYLTRLAVSLARSSTRVHELFPVQKPATSSAEPPFCALELEPPREIVDLGERLELTHNDCRLMALVLAPAYDVRLQERYAALVGARQPTMLTTEVLAALEGCTLFEVRKRYAETLVQRGTLLRMQLIRQEHGALLESAQLRAMLLGRSGLEESLQGAIVHHVGRSSLPLVLPEASRAEVESAARAWQDWDLAPLTLLVGPDGCGHTLAARRLASSIGLDVLEVDTAALAETGAVEPLVLVREARWLRAAVSLRFGAAGIGREWQRVIQTLAEHRVALTVSVATPQQAECLPDALRVHLPRPDASTRCELWAALLPARLRGEGIDDEWLAHRFRGTPRETARLAQAALAQARLQESRPSRLARVTREHFGAVAQRLLVTRLDSLAQRCPEVEGGLARVVVDDAMRSQIDDVLDRVRHHFKVFRAWGLGQSGYGLGTVVLLDGPPGTGKTWTASAIASELSIPLYRIDLSRVVSKWVGESEKHLDACFSEAEAAGVALLFDEADSLFSKRTSVSSANDRYANLEVNFLLQRIEQFDGLCFLTTNLERGLDEAFARRLAARLTFRAPDESERAALWRLTLDTGALPLADDIDVELLAADFETLSGADIKAIVVQAAFVAARDSSEIDHALLEQCAVARCSAAGYLIQHGAQRRKRTAVQELAGVAAAS